MSMVKSIENKDMGYTPFEEEDDAIKAWLLSQKYDEMVDQLIKGAKVSVNQDIYCKIYIK